MFVSETWNKRFIGFFIQATAILLIAAITFIGPRAQAGFAQKATCLTVLTLALGAYTPEKPLTSDSPFYGLTTQLFEASVENENSLSHQSQPTQSAFAASDVFVGRLSSDFYQVLADSYGFTTTVFKVSLGAVLNTVANGDPTLATPIDVAVSSSGDGSAIVTLAKSSQLATEEFSKDLQENVLSRPAAFATETLSTAAKEAITGPILAGKTLIINVAVVVDGTYDLKTFEAGGDTWGRLFGIFAALQVGRRIKLTRIGAKISSNKLVGPLANGILQGLAYANMINPASPLSKIFLQHLSKVSNLFSKGVKTLTVKVKGTPESRLPTNRKLIFNGQLHVYDCDENLCAVVTEAEALEELQKIRAQYLDIKKRFYSGDTTYLDWLEATSRALKYAEEQFSKGNYFKYQYQLVGYQLY